MIAETPRNTNEIFDWLFISGQNDFHKIIKNIDIWYDFSHFDKSFEVDVVKGIVRKKEAFKSPRFFDIPQEIDYRKIPFDDGDLEKAIPIWKDCFEEIIKEKGERRVLVSCAEGLSRSATLVLWLCCEEMGSYDKAKEHIAAIRRIFPDKKFEPFLKELKRRYP